MLDRLGKLNQKIQIPPTASSCSREPKTRTVAVGPAVSAAMRRMDWIWSSVRRIFQSTQVPVADLAEAGSISRLGVACSSSYPGECLAPSFSARR